MQVAHHVLDGEDVSDTEGPQMPPSAVRDAPSAALGTLIMAVTWDCVRRARLVSVSGSGNPAAIWPLRRESNHAARGRPGATSVLDRASKRPPAVDGPAGHLVIASRHADRGLLRR